MRDLLINIVQRQKQEAQEILKSATVVREVSSQLQSSLDLKQIKAVIGPRRSGKSTLAHQVLSNRYGEGKYAYINFEDDSLPTSLDYEILEQCLTQLYPSSTYIFFDEIQSYPRWEQLLNRLERVEKKIIISGSNSKLLSSELSFYPSCWIPQTDCRLHLTTRRC